MVVLMGRAGVGKSAVTLRFIEDRFVPEYDPTIEDMHKKECIVDGKPILLEILDIAGEAAYSQLRRGWMERGSGFLFVFSLLDRQTFDELDCFRVELMDMYPDDPPPSIILANKADEAEEGWVVRREEITRLQERWRRCTNVFYTSAKTNSNVSEAFQGICRASRQWRNDRITDPRRHSSDTQSMPRVPLSYNGSLVYSPAESRCCRCLKRERGSCVVL